MSQSPALGSFTRKTEEETEEETPEALSERMQYMIDMQNAYTQSIPGSNEEDEDTGGETTSEQHHQQEQPTINQPRAILPTTTYSDSSVPVNNPPDPTVGKGQIIFPSSYQLDGALHHHHHGGEDGLLLQDQFVVHEKSNYPDYLSDQKPPEPCCCCLWQPLVSCCTALWEAENLHRSFCYGAIDGMLTGAGLVATLSGFGLSATESWMVAVTLCACTADALCMALGHVWSTHVLSSHAAQDRRVERVSFEANRHESKAKLVDMLLSRGMLKIDAVSIADTLEGYPDIFVGALVGDAVVLPNNNHTQEDDAGPSYGGLSNTYGSYGKFNEMRHDPDAAAVKVAVAESRTEGFIMMISFALFGTLPAIIYHTVSSMNPAAAPVDDTSGLEEDYGGGADPAISPRSGAITITCIIMWFLGVWKRYVCRRVVVLLLP